MVAAGHQVTAMAAEDDQAVREALREIGVSYRSFPLERTGLNPLRDTASIVSLTRALSEIRADSILTYTAKPVIYGSFAAHIAGVPRRAAMITGVGSVLAGGSGGRGALAWILRRLYAAALAGVDLVFFQNPDDEALFRRLDLIGREQRVCRINGSGVDLARFSPAPMPEGPTTFLLISRLLREKGVPEYVEAARVVRKTHPQARFLVLGRIEKGPTAVTATQLESWRAEGAIEYLGVADDVRPSIAQAHAVVLPSFYGEGVPRSLLEGMAMARPIVTTDAPGCRETVEHWHNGLLVPVRDAQALADGMRQLLEAPDRLGEMGRCSRAMAEARFDVHAINRVILTEMGLAAPPR